MQFAGQRTDMNLKPVGKPDNYLIRLTGDILPQPDAILTHGISPQKANAEGLSEPEFLRFFTDKVVRPNTVFVGFNNIRFDDEFMRFSLWRNFYDAYEWQWKNGCGRWDLLDIARLTRALRPDGIEWPFASDGKPTVRLEALAAVNKLAHDSVHDALSDVNASIAVARLIKLKQPKLFEYLLGLRDKTKVEMLVSAGEPVVYTSGRYPSESLKTTIAMMVGPRTDQPGALMYDLCVDPDKFVRLVPDELARLWSARGPRATYFPVKTLRYNRCPAIAPLSTLDQASAKRLKIDLELVEKNRRKLADVKDFAKKLNRALTIMYPPRQPMLVADMTTVDGQLYDGFINGPDKIKMSVVRTADAETIAETALEFDDPRLDPLFRLYKARNFEAVLDKTEEQEWRSYRFGRLQSQSKHYFERLKELKDRDNISAEQKALLAELEQYGDSLV